MAKKHKSTRTLPRSPDYKAAQQSLVQSNVFALLSSQSRVSQVLQGAYQGRTYRAGGTSVYGYGIKKPKGDRGWKKYY